MRLHTASEGVTQAKQFESDSADYYTSLAQLFPKDAESLLSFAKENKNNIVQVERAYFGVITDAIEGCFAFDIDPADYKFETALNKDIGYADALNRALLIEGTIQKFYLDAGEQSKGLMADVSRMFSLIARKRNNRILKPESLKP